MNCYICESTPSAGGTCLGIASAVGICKGCGIGVCAHHGQRSSSTSFALLCSDCCERVEQIAVEETLREVAAESA